MARPAGRSFAARGPSGTAAAITIATMTTILIKVVGEGKRRMAHASSGEPFDLRDIRRTVETIMAGMKISKDDRAQVLSHGISGVQSVHYDRHGYADEKRAALRSWERKLDAISRGVQISAYVIPLHGTGQAR